MENQNEDKGSFELSLRILGNEFIGFRMSVGDIKSKWVVIGLAAVGIIAYTVGALGPEVASLIG